SAHLTPPLSPLKGPKGRRGSLFFINAKRIPLAREPPSFHSADHRPATPKRSEGGRSADRRYEAPGWRLGFRSRIRAAKRKSTPGPNDRNITESPVTIPQKVATGAQQSSR